MTGIAAPSRLHRLRADVVRVALGPWRIRPLFTGVFLALVFQYAAADVNAENPLSPPQVFASMPFSIARAAAIALPLWAVLTVRRWLTGGRPLTRAAYLGTVVVAGVFAGTMRFWLSDGDLASEPRLYAVFVLRATFILLCFFTLMGLADQRLRAQVGRADRALAEVERQQRIVLESEERAKDQVSQFLHNRVQAGLVAVGMQLRQLEVEVPTSTAAKVASIRDALETIRADDVRQASRALSPDIATMGLAAALRDLGLRYAPAVEVHVDAPALEALPGVSTDHLLACYRIVEQALLNAVAHGRATVVAVTVAVTDADLRISVVDNGTGLDPAQMRRGVGTALMDAWTSSFDGAWSIENGREGGAVLMARIRLAVPGLHA